MHPQIRSIADIYAFNSMALVPVLEDLNDQEARQQCRGGEGSSIAFLVGHMLSSRVGLLKRFGETTENPYAELFGAKVGAQDGASYPPIAELAAGWKEVGARLKAVLQSLGEEQLEAPAEGFPVADQTARGALMFLAWHESYHVGQIGMLRTELGKPSLQARLYEAMGGGQG